MRINNAEFQKKKNIILFIYGFSCQICGVIDIKNHVHHVDKNNGNNKADNLIPLCAYCHKIIHKSTKSIIPIRSIDISAKLDLLDSYF